MKIQRLSVWLGLWLSCDQAIAHDSFEAIGHYLWAWCHPVLEFGVTPSGLLILGMLNLLAFVVLGWLWHQHARAVVVR